MKIYVVYEAREGYNPEPMFAFHAKSLAAAKTMKDEWARRNLRPTSEFGVEENPNYREGNCPMHDDYVKHPSASRFLNFYLYQGEKDNRPFLAECHLLKGKIAREEVRHLLVEVATTTLEGRKFTVEDVETPSAFNLAAISATGPFSGQFIIATER